MTSKDKLFSQLARRTGVITTLTCIACVCIFVTLPKWSNKANVEEDTIMSGGTPVYISSGDSMEQRGIDEGLRELGLPVHTTGGNGSIKYTLVESQRADSREAIVYAFIGADSVGLTIAKSLRTVTWLSKDVYLLFVPKGQSFGEGIRQWLEEYSGESSKGEKGYIRGSFVLDLSKGSVGGDLFIDVEGRNGIFANQDLTTVLFDVADELRVPISIKSAYESLLISGMNGHVHSGHSAFLDHGIPSITLSRSNTQTNARRVSTLELAQLVGKHLRAVSGLHHQFHHSTSFYVFTGHKQEVSLGLVVPVIVGMISPLFVGVFSSSANNELPHLNLMLFMYVVGAVVIVGGGLLLSLMWEFNHGICSSTLPAGVMGKSSFLVPLSVTSTLSIVWLLIGKWISDQFESSSSPSSFGTGLKVASQKVFSMILTMLLLLNWGAALIPATFIVPLFTLVSPPTSTRAGIASATVSITTLVVGLCAFLSLLSGHWFFPFPRALIMQALDTVTLATTQYVPAEFSPVECLLFLKSLVGGSVAWWKPLSTLIHEFACVGGMAGLIVCAVISPAILLAVIVFFASPEVDTETMAGAEMLGKVATGKKDVIRRIGVVVSVIVALIVYQQTQ